MVGAATALHRRDGRAPMAVSVGVAGGVPLQPRAIRCAALLYSGMQASDPPTACRPDQLPLVGWGYCFSAASDRLTEAPDPARFPWQDRRGSALGGSMGAERVHPSPPNRPVKRTASIDIAAQAAHGRAEALEKAVRRHEYAVEMAANNGDVVIANWSGGPRHTRVRVHAYRSLWLTPKKTPETYGCILLPWC